MTPIAAARIGAAATRDALAYPGRPGECDDFAGERWLQARAALDASGWELYRDMFRSAVDLLAAEYGLCRNAGCGRVVVASEGRGYSHCRACLAAWVEEFRRVHARPAWSMGLEDV